jgi:hypothetical protein
MDDFIAERPSAALDTLISTMVTVTGQTSVVRTASNLVERRARAEMAKAQNERFVKIMEAAKDSKLRERDPQSFAQFVDSAAEASGADIQDVYIDARTLMGSTRLGSTICCRRGKTSSATPCAPEVTSASPSASCSPPCLGRRLSRR